LAAAPAEGSGVGAVPTAQAKVIPVTPAVAAATTDEDTTLLRLRWSLLLRMEFDISHHLRRRPGPGSSSWVAEVVDWS
jgi:hypothetical protein